MNTIAVEMASPPATANIFGAGAIDESEAPAASSRRRRRSRESTPASAPAPVSAPASPPGEFEGPALSAALEIQLKHATIELHYLLQSVPESLLRAGPELSRALWRYENIFLPLVAEKPAVAPPPDVAWVWFVHMLAPEHYVEDLQRGGTRSVPKRLPPEGKWSTIAAAGTAGVDYERAKLGLAWSDAVYQTSKGAWDAVSKGEPYFLPWTYTPAPFKPPPPKGQNKSAPAVAPLPAMPQHQSAFGYDIAAACDRQRVFNYQVSLPHYHSEEFIGRAVMRYGIFLSLKRKHPDKFLVPCYDFDLVWHAHQLMPSYEADTSALIGKMLNHDDSVNDRAAGSRLNNAAQTTTKLWEEFTADPNETTPVAQQMQVIVPPNVTSGQPFNAQTPTGVMQVVCPAGFKAGDAVMINVPPAQQALDAKRLSGRSFHADGAMFRGAPPPSLPPSAPELDATIEVWAHFKSTAASAASRQSACGIGRSSQRSSSRRLACYSCPTASSSR